MIASFHIVEYRRPAVSPPKGLVGAVTGLRFWRPLNIGGDFGWFHDHPGRWGLYRRLKPDFRRWAFYAVWDDGEALHDFLAGSDVARRWSDRATEACHLWLRPNHVRGPWEGVQLLHGSERAGKPAERVAYLVRLDLSVRGTFAMWGSAAPRLLPHLPGSDDLLLGLPLVDRPYTQPVSFSLWRAPRSATRFVRGEGAHRAAVRRVQRSQHDLVARFSSGRFEPYRCEGTWKGRRPLAAA